MDIAAIHLAKAGVRKCNDHDGGCKVDIAAIHLAKAGVPKCNDNVRV